MDGHHYRTEMADGCTAIRETLEASDGVASAAHRLDSADRIYAVGCGSSYWTATVAAGWLRERGHDAVSVPASEFALSPYPVDAGTAVLAYSQSGETTETVGAVDGLEADLVAVTNTAGSTLDGLADSAVVTPAGEERAVLASKSVDAALAVSWLLAAGPGAAPPPEALAGACRRALETDLGGLRSLFEDADRAYLLGSGPAYGFAGEAATKLGEGALIHSTALPTFEFSHGPISNAAGVPAVLIDPDPDHVAAHVELLEEMREAGVRTGLLAAGDAPEAYLDRADAAAVAPDGGGTLLPALKLVQALTHALAVERDLDPDDPPALSKFVERSGLGADG